jgi:hypothetical protein
MARGFCMTRIFAATAILICLAFSIFPPAHSQGSRNLATDNGCFPWQDFKNGQCVAKPPQASPPPLPSQTPEPSRTPLPSQTSAPFSAVAPPPPPPVVASPCPDGASNVAGQCVCPASTHLDNASGRCVADITTRRPELVITCDGGTVTGGACVCPQGFNLAPASEAAGGTCVRTDADNCLGGEMTVSGKCMCNGQVTMDGETYLLEFANGKCLPMRCPVTALRDGKCSASSSAKAMQEPETRERPARRESRESGDEDGEPRRRCGRGMVYTRSGCVAEHRRHEWDGNETTLRQYYRKLYPGPVTPPF